MACPGPCAFSNSTSATSFPDQTAPVTPYRVTATVYWGERGAERHLSLASLRLGEPWRTPVWAPAPPRGGPRR